MPNNLAGTGSIVTIRISTRLHISPNKPNAESIQEHGCIMLDEILLKNHMQANKDNILEMLRIYSMRQFKSPRRHHMPEITRSSIPKCTPNTEYMTCDSLNAYNFH
ncbi:hypothetical protein CBL_20650 [Carabus blaptoides fortunei]